MRIDAREGQLCGLGPRDDRLDVLPIVERHGDRRQFEEVLPGRQEQEPVAAVQRHARRLVRPGVAQPLQHMRQVPGHQRLRGGQIDSGKAKATLDKLVAVSGAA